MNLNDKIHDKFKNVVALTVEESEDMPTTGEMVTYLVIILLFTTALLIKHNII